MAEDSSDKSDADYYGLFMSALLGLVDDAELSGYDAGGLSHLRKARDLFLAEFNRQYPGHWKDFRQL